MSTSKKSVDLSDDPFAPIPRASGLYNDPLDKLICTLETLIEDYWDRVDEVWNEEEEEWQTPEFPGNPDTPLNQYFVVPDSSNLAFELSDRLEEFLYYDRLSGDRAWIPDDALQGIDVLTLRSIAIAIMEYVNCDTL